MYVSKSCHCIHTSLFLRITVSLQKKSVADTFLFVLNRWMTYKVRMRRMMMTIMMRSWKRVSITPILVHSPWHKPTHPFQFSTLTKRTSAQSSISLSRYKYNQSCITQRTTYLPTNAFQNLKNEAYTVQILFDAVKISISMQPNNFFSLYLLQMLLLCVVNYGVNSGCKPVWGVVWNLTSSMICGS